ncbi:ABC transporter ATP-binding protein [Thioflexithrix psekupsensis]|uniref:ABC transporter n=1 Tax=Thioflexithrix psekupsensis TaxID=1570016 RepID=A0A251X7B3_9GAMM|nr:ABC transporter ATP-binding protein [Thioflexithrix psekupsensis]OUD13871.1 ABC transporter [Thioflexithrix psekupsensis]
MTKETIVSAVALGKQVHAPEGILTLLNAVNLSIDAHEAVAILGASGSGKSTLLGLLAGLDQPTQGYVSLFGQNITELNEDQRAQLRAGRVGFVFQSFHLLPALTALENVMLPMELAGIDGVKNKAISILEQVGLISRLKHLPSQLSGGEQQRVALARAFAAQPSVLFADEPTGNLDQQTGQKIIDLLFSLKQEQGTTLILVTHDAKLAQHCDRRCYLNQGQLQEAE